MKACPYCSDAPNWHFASNVTRLRNSAHSATKGPSLRYWLFTGCRHAREFFGTFRFISDPERPAIEATWDAHAETLFAAYTEHWTEPQRATFRARLWPKPITGTPSELFDRNRDERPAVNYAGTDEEKHPLFD